MMEVKTFEQIDALVKEWANDRALVKIENVKSQALKVVEEVGELCRDVNKNDREAIIDDVGDVLVTISILCAQLGLHPVECFKAAYDEIKNRKGKTVNGTFIKE